MQPQVNTGGLAASKIARSPSYISPVAGEKKRGPSDRLAVSF
jgi:hypothetical protein